MAGGHPAAKPQAGGVRLRRRKLPVFAIFLSASSGDLGEIPLFHWPGQSWWQTFPISTSVPVVPVRREVERTLQTLAPEFVSLQTRIEKCHDTFAFRPTSPGRSAWQPLLVASSGCTAFFAPTNSYPITPSEPSPHSPVPRELDKVSLPPYVIEPPDILMINAIKVVPKSPHKIEPFDGLLIRVLGTLPDQSIADAFAVDPEGTVDLGPSYGRVKVVGLTIDEAQSAIHQHLSQVLESPQVSVSLAFSSGAQQIVGEHLVGPDGRVNLGTYGSVYVTGLTIDEARAAIEEQLSDYLEDPQVVVDIFAYNSKKYYVITQGAGFGDNVTTAPITGNETVLDAVATSAACRSYRRRKSGLPARLPTASAASRFCRSIGTTSRRVRRRRPTIS